jgi:hypothetical protein
MKMTTNDSSNTKFTPKIPHTRLSTQETDLLLKSMEVIWVQITNEEPIEKAKSLVHPRKIKLDF